MILNQREKSELIALLASSQVNLKFTTGKNKVICIKHPEFDLIKATVKRNSEGFGLDYFQSTSNKIVSVNVKDFASLKYRLSQWFGLIKKDYPRNLEVRNNIKRLSGRYYKVLEEAIVIRNLGFEDSSGMIFRKALEILIKDYFLFLLPSFEEEIMNKTIGRIINYFYKIKDGEFEVKQSTKFDSIKIRLEEIKSLCKKIKLTFDIGNDFAHYERKLEQLSTEELHLNILKIEEFIDIHLQEEYLKDMKAFLSAEFDEEDSI